MSKTKHNRPDPRLTHLAGRTKRSHFNRGGIRWEQKWQVFAIASLSEEQLAAIESEPEVETRRLTEDAAIELVEEQTPVTGNVHHASRAEMLQQIAELQRIIGERDATITELSEKLRLATLPREQTILTGAPPSQREQAQLDGSNSPLPLPPVK